MFEQVGTVYAQVAEVVINKFLFVQAPFGQVLQEMLEHAFSASKY